jgi:hypothetical protein
VRFGHNFELSDFMHLGSTLAVAAALGLAVPSAAWAGGVDSGLEVRVNPIPPGGGGVLLYPGGEYSRVVPPLLYPGERGGPIHLHMPGPHRRVIARAAPRAETPKPPPPPKRVARAEPPPVRSAPTPAPNENPFGGATNLNNVFGSAAPVPRTAPAGPVSGNENLTKRSVILFAKEAPDPAKSALGAIKFLASELNASMTSANARVELQAFGGNKGDKGSDARGCRSSGRWRSARC